MVMVALRRLSLEALLGGRRNVAGPLLLLNLALYVSMLGFASWALNTFVNDLQMDYYPDDACGMCMDAPTTAGGAGDDEATLHFIQFALLAAVLGSAAKAAAAFHARKSWRPQGLAAAAALATVAWAATALALGLACREMRAAEAAARGWRMRALEAITAVLAVTQLAYVLMLHRAAACTDEDAHEADDAAVDACGDQLCDEPGCSTATEGDDVVDSQHAPPPPQHGHHHHHRQGQGGGPSCGVL